MYFRRLIPVLAFCVVVISSSISNSASITFEVQESEFSDYRRLVLKYDGPIQSGDAKRISEILKQTGFVGYKQPIYQRNVVVDFNSEGGSFAEAIKLMDLFRKEFIQTYVGVGRSCLSACALSFLGGYDAQEGYAVISRTLHPRGKLGFHAPSLSLPGEGSIPVSQLTKAYKLALKTVSLMIEQKGKLKIGDSLIAIILNTPPEDMYLVSTIDDAIRWNISVAFDDKGKKLNASAVVNVCRNYSLWEDGKSGQENDFYNEYWASQIERVNIVKLGKSRLYHVRINEENGNTCYVISNTSTNARYFEILYSTSSNKSVLNTIKTRNVGLSVADWLHTLPWNTKLSTLKGTESKITHVDKLR